MEAAAFELDPVVAVDLKPAALLRGTARGLEVVIDATADVDAITGAMVMWLDKAPGFFKGSDVRIRVESGPLAPGCLGRIDTIAERFELRIAEVTAAKVAIPLGVFGVVDEPQLAQGSAPTNDVAEAIAEFDDVPTGNGPVPAGPITVEQLVAPHLVDEDEPTLSGAPIALAATAETALATKSADSSATRVVVGPVRSGVILDHEGHLFIFGDVNPGAEVRATGNIVVLGRLRGTAHAGIGQELGFILALRLEPQQLRVGRKVARSGEDFRAVEPEIAFLTDDKIVVERYQGRLPRNLASSI
ncbi:MAG: septum site-determining protein MinC [Kofleriaceae bacterium]